jgi:hypothetical protein
MAPHRYFPPLVVRGLVVIVWLSALCVVRACCFEDVFLMLLFAWCSSWSTRGWCTWTRESMCWRTSTSCSTSRRATSTPLSLAAHCRRRTLTPEPCSCTSPARPPRRRCSTRSESHGSNPSRGRLDRRKFFNLFCKIRSGESPFVCSQCLASCWVYFAPGFHAHVLQGPVQADPAAEPPPCRLDHGGIY